MSNEKYDKNENNLNAINVPVFCPQNGAIEMDKNGVMNLTTKTKPNANFDMRQQLPVSSNNGMNSNFSCGEPIILQSQMVLPNCNFIKYDLIPETSYVQGNLPKTDIPPQCFVQPAEGFQYLHFMMNDGFATADLTGNFVNGLTPWVNVASMMCVEAPVVAPPEVAQKKKGTKTEVPPFLKRNRSKSKDALPVETEVKLKVVSVQEEGDEDVIFMGEYKNGEKPNAASPLIISINSEDSLDDVPLTDRVSSPIVAASDVKKRKRSKIINPTRRNPKRKVQIEKKSMELALRLSEIDDFKRPTSKKQLQDATGCRRSARQLASSGSIYIPPKALTCKDIKKWPVHGMHERPEYDPIKSIIHPFDYTIRGIEKSKRVHQKHTTMLPNTSKDNQEFIVKNLDFEILRYVIGFLCQSKKLKLHKPQLVIDEQNNEQIVVSPNSSMKVLLSEPKKENDAEENDKESVEQKHLKELLFDCCLLYCLTNNVNQRSLANYLMEFDSEVAVDWLNNQILREVN